MRTASRKLALSLLVLFVGLPFFVPKAAAQAPIITTQPGDVSVASGGGAVFTVAAGGGALTYQWQKNGFNLPGKTAPTLSLAPVVAADFGAYAVVVTNGFGSVTSDAAFLSVTSPGGPVYAPADYAEPTTPGAEWLYAGPVFGSVTHTRVFLESTAKPVVCYDASAPPLPVVRPVVSYVHAFGSLAGSFIPSEIWSEYWDRTGGVMTFWGDDQFGGTVQTRAAGGADYPAALAVGESEWRVLTMVENGAVLGTGHVGFRLVGVESVTVPAGTFSGALHLQFVLVTPANTSVNDEWWVPGIGQVKRHRVKSNDPTAMDSALLSFNGAGTGAAAVFDTTAAVAAGATSFQGSRILAQKFALPGAASVTQISVLLTRTGATGAAVLEVWSDGAGLPAAAVGTLTTAQAIVGGVGLYTFRPPSALTLPAGNHWVVLRDTSGAATEQFRWWHLPMAGTGTGAGFRVDNTFSDSAGASGTWAPVTLGSPSVMKVEAIPVVAPGIAVPPAGVTIASGATSGLAVTATGTASLSYQWYRGDSGDVSSPVTGALGASFTTPPLTAWARYWVRVSNAFGAADSATALVRVTGGTVTLADWTALPGVPVSERGPLATPAGDGVTNLMKFAHGVPPMDGAAARLPKAVVVTEVGKPDALALEFTFNPLAQGIRVALQISPDMASWSEVPAVLEVLATNPDGTQSVRLREAAPPAATKRFGRLLVELTP